MVEGIVVQTWKVHFLTTVTSESKQKNCSANTSSVLFLYWKRNPSINHCKWFWCKKKKPTKPPKMQSWYQLYSWPKIKTGVAHVSEDQSFVVQTQLICHMPHLGMMSCLPRSSPHFEVLCCGTYSSVMQSLCLHVRTRVVSQWWYEAGALKAKAGRGWCNSVWS